MLEQKFKVNIEGLYSKALAFLREELGAKFAAGKFPLVHLPTLQWYFRFICGMFGYGCRPLLGSY